MFALSERSLIKQGAAPTAAGTTTVNGATIDMANYEGCLFIARFGTAATDNTINAQQGKLSDASDMTDLKDTKVGVGASDEIVWLDIVKPQEQYLRLLALRGTSTTLDWAVAILYGARKQPPDNTVAGTIHGETHISPVEGTA